MALEPYRRRIGLPDAPGPSGMVDTRVADIGGAIASIGDTLMRTFEPIHREEAIKQAQKDAGNIPLEMDDKGQLVLPQSTGGGRVYADAFDKVATGRYLNQINIDYQDFLNTEISQRRTRDKPFDPDDFEVTVGGRLQGILDAVDPTVRADAEQLLGREMLERTRTFRDEWSRTRLQQDIAGFNDQNRFYLQSIANWRDRPGETLESVTERYITPMLENVARMKEMGLAGDREADAQFMAVDQLTDGIESYTASITAAATIIPAIGGMTAGDLQMTEYWLRGVPVEGGLSGLVTGGGGASVKVDPNVLKEHFKITFGFDPTSVERAADHPLSKKNPKSHHNVAVSGRAVDSPRIPGMTFDEYVQSWKDAGFTVVEAIDEYKNPSPHATGGHWHVAFANTRTLPGEPQEIPEVKGLTYEQINQLDPSVKNTLLQVVTDRRQVLAQQQAEARREAAESARHREEMEQLRTLGQTIDGANSGGFGGNWTAKEKGVLNERFRSAVDPSRLHEMDMRVTASRWIAQNNYVPREIVNYLDSGIRHPTAWRPALELYQNLQQTTMGNGARVGDLLVMELDPRTRALLEQGRILKQSMSDEEVGARLETLRSGSGFTKKEAQAAFAETTEERYDQVRNKQLREAYGIPSNQAIAPELIDRFDESYAANLDLVDRNPAKAMQRALEQNAGLMTRRGIFADGVGPSVLTRTYSNEKLRDFFTGAINPTTGQPLIPKNQGHLIGGNQSTVKLKPLGNALSSIGRYEVRVFNPKNPSELIDRFEVDLGSELNGFFGENDRQVTTRPMGDPVGEARASLERQLERGSQTFRRAVRETNPFAGRRD